MRSCTFRLALVGLLGAMPTLGGSACRSTDPGTTNLAFDPDVDHAKVDADVLRAMATGDSLSVIVLGQNQLLERIGGLEQFEQSHDGVPAVTIAKAVRP